MSKGYCDAQVRKQISIFVPNADWRALREEAARQRLPVTELCRRWLRPGLERLRRPSGTGVTDPRHPPSEREKCRGSV
jgi:hypothetical protein